MPEENRYRGLKEINYKTGDLSDLKYIKIIYTDKAGEIHEHKTEINYMSDDFISLYVKKVKEEDTEDEKDEPLETWEQEKQDSMVTDESYSDYMQKLAEIKQAKEKAEITGNFDLYYKKLEEIKNTSLNVKPKEIKEEPIEEVKEEIKEIGEDSKETENSEETKEKENNEFDVECPQEVILKFVLGELLYVSKATLKTVDIKATKVYFKTAAPQVLEFQQHRRFYRIELKRLCLLIANKKDIGSEAFVARSINLSAGGVLINRLEGMESNKYVSINPEEYESFNLIIVLELDKILKLSAKYIRQEQGRKSYRYAFEFINIEEAKTNYISKYVIGKQLEELQAEYKIKNNRGVINNMVNNRRR